MKHQNTKKRLNKHNLEWFGSFHRWKKAFDSDRNIHTCSINFLLPMFWCFSFLFWLDMFWGFKVDSQAKFKRAFWARLKCSQLMRIGHYWKSAWLSRFLSVFVSSRLASIWIHAGWECFCSTFTFHKAWWNWDFVNHCPRVVMATSTKRKPQNDFAKHRSCVEISSSGHVPSTLT